MTTTATAVGPQPILLRRTTWQRWRPAAIATVTLLVLLVAIPLLISTGWGVQDWTPLQSLAVYTAIGLIIVLAPALCIVPVMVLAHMRSSTPERMAAYGEGRRVVAQWDERDARIAIEDRPDARARLTRAVDRTCDLPASVAVDADTLGGPDEHLLTVRRVGPRRGETGLPDSTGFVLVDDATDTVHARAEVHRATPDGVRTRTDADVADWTVIDLDGGETLRFRIGGGTSVLPDVLLVDRDGVPWYARGDGTAELPEALSAGAAVFLAVVLRTVVRERGERRSTLRPASSGD